MNLVKHFVKIAEVNLEDEIKEMRTKRIPSKIKREMRRKYAKRHAK
jgi:hypothetical protein